ncbi:hypothetical protein [Phenylobacterium sp.]|jgi:hypothetical protein|uniref:hypothetical protein n=1 Tax=Phenylobacterium sp. TaxID=1871053 RepID=UPI002E304CD0|nr:hypothetical protein [Phenylobacterium sp.]HEX3363774.1 hypothetical protein [Phenylobacterium sp.]
MSDTHAAAGGEQNSPKRGAAPTPRHLLAGAMPYMPGGLEAAAIAPRKAPAEFIRIPKQISMWGNYYDGDCVTAEEAFAKACNAPEVFVPDATVTAWASAHGVLNGANLHEVMVWMQTGGFVQAGHTYDDGSILSVNWTNAAVLNHAIWEGPVKIGVAANQLEATWHAAGGSVNGGKNWFATGYHHDAAEDHCVSLCGYGPLAWLAGKLHVPVPAGVNGAHPGYALFTWDSIGVIDAPSMLAITQEAWLRTPTTVIH